MDAPLSSTPTSDATLEEGNNFTKSEVSLEDDGVVLAQPVTMDKLVVLLTPSANTPTQEAQDLAPKATRSHETPQPLKPCFLFPYKFNLILEQCFNALLFFGICM